jgi:glycerol-3-phosphate acyltransferase PlsX
MPRIAIDTMGGDQAPGVPIAGAIRAVSEHPELEVVLVGPTDLIEESLASAGCEDARIQIVHSSEWITMADSPVEALRTKPDSSMNVMVRLHKDGAVDGIFSAGNTGAMVASCSMQLRMLEGVRRPAIALPLPCGENPMVLCDGGANVECKPVHLLQNAIMAASVLRCAYSVENPRVGLLNVGSEKDKGHSLAKETFQLLEKSGLQFIGNVEGSDIFQSDVDDVDVVVCDGFVGNIVLKTAEGFSEELFQILATELGDGSGDSGDDSGSTGALLERGLQRIRSRFDYSEYGGAPLLGPRGVCTIGHGRSDEKAVSNALGWTLRMIETGVQQDVIESIRTEMEMVEAVKSGQAESSASS